ncbi:MAG: HEAT repeat domain-containing protein [Candidatus Riflebacteria bacterium]|nr:HEAT repeat domain-containing protein [Candidatus Riflebacteria bacterium]
MTELQRTVQALMMDPNPMTRLYAIDLLTQNAHRLEPDTVVLILQGASNDRDEEVTRSAKLSMSRLLQTDFGASDKLRELGIHSRMTEMSDVEREREQELRRVALEVLQPAAAALRQYVPAHPLAPEALVLLGALRDHGSVHLIVDAVGNPALRERAFDALQEFRTPEVLALVNRLMEREMDERLLARLADVMGESQTVEALGLLTKLSTSPSEMVREHVALGLGKLPRRVAEAQLVTMWERERSQQVQLVLLSSLGRAGRDLAADAIVRRMSTVMDDRVLSKALMALGQIGLARTAQTLLEQLPSTNTRVRANALEALSRIPLQPKDAVAAFGPYLSDKNNRVRGNAIVALHVHEPRRALDELKRMANSDRPNDRATAAWVASQLQSPEALEQLAVQTATELDKSVQNSCLAAVARLRNPRSRAILARLMAHPSPQVRQQAALACGRVGGPAVLRELEKAYQQTDNESSRATLVTAMGLASHQGNLTFLQRKLGEHSEKVVLAAIEALDHVGALEAAVMLEPFAGHANPRIRAAAVIALWNLGHLNASACLGRMLTARDDISSRAAFAALGTMSRQLSWRELEKRPLLLSALTERIKNLPARDELSMTMSGVVDLESQDATSETELALADIVKAMAELREDAASELARGLLVREPGNVCAHFVAARLASRTATAHEAPGPIVRDGRFLYLLAEKVKAAKAAGDFDTMLATHFEIFSLHTEMLQEYIRMGKGYLERNDSGGAGAVAKFIVSQLQWTEDLHRRLGMLYLAEKDYEKAAEQLWRACVNTPEEPGPLLELARAAAGLGKLRLARSLIALVVGRDGVDPRLRAKAQQLVARLGTA